ncbi:MAG TPA: Rnf-Nqr domain containing protein [Bacillota bacterium]|nr:Rnf-Nqr domain containing protein [Bacillota bacterium]
MRDILYILVVTVIANNVLFVRFEGLSTLIGPSEKRGSALFISIATSTVLIFSSAAGWALERYVIQPLGIEYLRIVLLLFIIACMVQFLENIFMGARPALIARLNVYFPIITVNSAILGNCTGVIEQDYSLLLAIVSAAGIGAGFSLGMFLFTGVRGRIEDSALPESFRGTPAALIAASIVSLAFLGFEGAVSGIFGM